MRISSNRVTSAFTLVEIMIVVAIIGLLAALAVPSLTKNRETAQLQAIKNNLRMIDNAKEQWALESGQIGGVEPKPEDLDPYLKRGFPPKKVVGEEYNIKPVGEAPTATIPGKLGDYSANSEISAWEE